MRSKIFHCLTFVVATASLAAQSLDRLGFSFRYNSGSFRDVDATLAKRCTDTDNGDNLPDPAAPLHPVFMLHQIFPSFVRPDEREFTDAQLDLIPLGDPSVKDFAKAYSDLAGNAAGLRALLKAKTIHPALNTNLPEWALIDAAQTLHAKLQVVEGSWCIGIQYLTQEVQDATPIINERLTYVFQGVSRDGAYYISLKAPVAHPMLKPYGQKEISDAAFDAYLAEMETKLTQAPDFTFAPSLVDLRALVTSIHPSAVQPKPN